MSTEDLVDEIVSLRYKTAYLQAKADNVALHKGIRRLTKKVKELKQQLQVTQFYAATLERNQYVPEDLGPVVLLSDEVDPVTRAYNSGVANERKEIVSWLYDSEGERFLAQQIEKGEHLRDQS